MGIFDPDEVITEYSLKEAIEDGALVEIFKNKWKQLSGGKPIVATMNIYEQVSKQELMEIWKGYVSWRQQVFPKRSSEERLFSTEVNGMIVWVIEDAVCITIIDHVSGRIIKARPGSSVPSGSDPGFPDGVGGAQGRAKRIDGRQGACRKAGSFPAVHR